MEGLKPEEVWYLSGLVVSGAVWLLKKLSKSFEVADRTLKQLTALAFSVVVNVAIPLCQKEPLPETGKLVLAILATWMTAMAAHSIVKSATEKLAGGE